MFLGNNTHIPRRQLDRSRTSQCWLLLALNTADSAGFEFWIVFYCTALKHKLHINCAASLLQPEQNLVQNILNRFVFLIYVLIVFIFKYFHLKKTKGLPGLHAGLIWGAIQRNKLIAEMLNDLFVRQRSELFRFSDQRSSQVHWIPDRVLWSLQLNPDDPYPVSRKFPKIKWTQKSVWKICFIWYIL